MGAVVAQRHGLFLALEGDDRRHRPEDLVAEDGVLEGHSGEHGRLEEEAGSVGGVAAGSDFGARPRRDADQLAHLFLRPPVDEGAQPHAGLQAGPGAHRRHGGGKLGGELLGDRGLHVEAVGGDARLPAVAHLGDHGAFDGGLDVGVLEHQERGVASQFHRAIQDAGGRLRQQGGAHLGGPRERQLPYPRVPEHDRDDLRGAVRRHHVQHSGRHSRLFQQLCHGQGGQRSVGSRLEDHGAAGGDGRPDLAGGHGGGEVPRRDQHRHSHRLVDGEDALVTGGSGLDRPHIAHRLPRVPAEELGGVDRLPLRLWQRLSHLADDELGEVTGALRHRGESPAQDLAPLLRGRRRPFPLGGRGGVHSCLGVFFGGTRHRGDRLRRRRVEHLDLGAV